MEKKLGRKDMSEMGEEATCREKYQPIKQLPPCCVSDLGDFRTGHRREILTDPVLVVVAIF